MGKLVVEVCEVLSVDPHPNADRLEIATVKGWRTCIRKGDFKPGDKCIYFPPDSVLPEVLANGPDDAVPGRLGVRNYCSELPKNEDGTKPTACRVKAARLRGYPSYGVITHILPDCGDNKDWEVGTDLAEHFGVTKWEPPVKILGGDIVADHPLFHRYTDIENVGNFPDLIPIGTEVTVTEKLHGTNSRMGLVFDEPEWKFMAGSHATNRKEPGEGETSLYWGPMIEAVRNLLKHVRDEHKDCKSVLIFGEIFGPGVQDMTYGITSKGYRAFDIAVDGTYLNNQMFKAYCSKWGVETVPILFEGPLTKETYTEFTDGNTTMCDKDKAGKFKGREGVVVKPLVEKLDPIMGRVILKSISADYLARSGGTDSH